MNGAQLRDQGIAQQLDRNPATIEQFLNLISIMRKCRLRMAHTYDQCFTVEQLLAEVQSLCPHKAATSLYGAIGRMARQRGFISETGLWTASARDSRHANRAPVCCWSPDRG